MAATYTNNWINNTEKVSESALKALENLVMREKELIEKGWRWIKLSARTKVLVPCDEDGNPTEDSVRIIEETKRKDI